MNTFHAASGPPDSGAIDWQAGPTVSRMIVGARLRRLRETRGISREDAGWAIRGSHSKISRLELGRTGFKQRDVADLLTLYGVDDDGERATLLAVAEEANASAWWHEYGDVMPGWFEPYVGLEQGTGMIRTYQLQFVPGLLQTPEYAYAVIRMDNHDAPRAEIERRVALRMRRQQVLQRPDPPKLWAILDEAVVRRRLGGTATMRAQLEHLIEMAELSHITVQVISFDASGHAAAGGPITLLRFREYELPDVVYLEQLTSALYPDKPEVLDHYTHVMDRLAVAAEPPDATAAILHRILAET